MSSTSSSTPLLSASPATTWEHGVFLCFRGEDTREGITGHIFRALVGSGINTFMDERLAKGRDISELLDRIGKSRVSLVIFSENFASSQWCLDELVKILECRERLGQEVWPVFYKVPPSELRELRGKTGDYLAMQREMSGISPEKVEQWRLAVRHFADLKGWHFTEGYSESKLVTQIVKTVKSILDPATTVAAPPDQVTVRVDEPARPQETNGYQVSLRVAGPPIPIPTGLDITRLSKTTITAIVAVKVITLAFVAFIVLLFVNKIPNFQFGREPMHHAGWN